MVQITVDGITASVERKRIRSMNIRVKAPDGDVRVSVPLRTTDSQVRRFLALHMEWIKQQKQQISAAYPVRSYAQAELFPVFGVLHKLELRETTAKRSCGVHKEGKCLILTVLPDSTREDRLALLQKWQRVQLQDVAGILLRRWAKYIGVEVKEWHIKRMRTKWGTCNYRAHRIWLSLALAEQPIECVEYVVVHELCHLLEPSHNERFWAYMTTYLPDWKERRKKLNTPQK